MVSQQGSSTEGESSLKIRLKDVVDGQQVNVSILPLVGPEGRIRLDATMLKKYMLYSQEKLERPSTKGYLYPKPTQCRKVNEVGDLMTREPAIEAPMNDGRNYNGPKVAKFLVGGKAANKVINQIGFPNFHRVEVNDLTEGIRKVKDVPGGHSCLAAFFLQAIHVQLHAKATYMAFE
ncbi:hypothetical protein GOBAR_AA09083 [Gossypium barbadense]|uniref:Uncharacterized protein n=1 Tax=Gossypium barbadense TaxID=3634 RepID=A0A2P5Y7J1_GOSBA|nr:hypothetical protein GOBAR_AA09083 [Gossypium barbadense]